MSFLKKIKAGVRAAAAVTRSCPGWKRDIAMIQFDESVLPRAAEKGLLPEGTLEYATEIIELCIQGKLIAKTRWQWAQWKNSQSPFPSFPYRSYDSDLTTGKNIHDALLDLVSLNKANPELSLDELYNLIQDKYWGGIFVSPIPRPTGNSKPEKSASPQNEPQTPRLHHYNFAYKALPGLAFTDPYVPLGFATDTPNGSLAKFWKLVGTRLPVNERIDSTGLWAADVLADSMVFLVITMPPPLNKSEAYFVAIIYPQSWFDDPTEKSKLPAHFPQYFVLAMSDVPGAEGVSGGTLRLFNKAGHGAVKFGVPVTDSAFMMEIRNILKKPVRFVTWVESKPWDFVMRNDETGQIYLRAQTIDPPMQTPEHRGKLLIVDDEEGPRESMRVIFQDEYEMFFAEDGPTAIELAKQHDIDIVVTNICMPGMSGIEVLERLKILKPDIEVIMMTGFETNDTLRQSLRLGACDYINKPFDLETMRAAISKAMQRRTRERGIC